MYVNYANRPASDSHAVEVADVATVLANAGHAPSAPKANGSVYGRSGSEFDGYKPVDGSPAINAGKVISDMNDYAVTNDFFGNTIKGTPDLGAVESNVLSVSGKSTRTRPPRSAAPRSSTCRSPRRTRPQSSSFARA